VYFRCKDRTVGKPEHYYYVYIVASRSHTLYIGITDNIQRRIEQHRDAALPGFTATYHCNRLVLLEAYQYVQQATAREKQLKGWKRSKKIWLIELTNPTWADLSEAWSKQPQVPPLRFAPVEKHFQARTADTADLSTTLRSGRDDKGEGGASIECGC
jgi:putative endonuclease